MFSTFFSTLTLKYELITWDQYKLRLHDKQIENVIPEGRNDVENREITKWTHNFGIPWRLKDYILSIKLKQDVLIKEWIWNKLKILTN